MLDLGCGEGAIAAGLAAGGRRVTAADVSAVALERAARLHPELEGALVRVPPAGPLPFADLAFDAVWCSQVIEQVVDVQGLLSELRRVLRPAGRLALTTAYHGRVRDGLAALVAFERAFPVTGSRLRCFTRRSLAETLVAFGFDDVRVQGAGGVPLWRAALFATARRGSLS